MDSELIGHCAEIERCNQRGSRMLSFTDLVEAGTLTVDWAAYSLAAIGAGASFMVGASPGEAGKTTVMCALLGFVPAGVRLVAAADEAAIEDGLAERRERRCYICHEIGPGCYYAYLWGAPLRRYFQLPAAGHMLATNLHADTIEQAREQVCEINAVPSEEFRRMNILFFLAVEHAGGRTVRRIEQVWESDGRAEHRLLRAPSDSALVTGAALGKASRIVADIVASGARRIGQVRAMLLARR